MPGSSWPAHRRPPRRARSPSTKRSRTWTPGRARGDRTKWGVQAENLETGETFRGDGLNGFQSQRIPAGQYRISEYSTDRTPPGYRFRDWNCGGVRHTDPEPVITLGENQNLTCTVTNEAVRSSLTLRKEVAGGSAEPGLWTLRAMDGPTYVGGAANSSAVTDARVRPGTYRLEESGGPEAYEDGDWQCQYQNHQGGTGELPVDSSGRITISLDQQVTCTVVNTVDTTQLTLVKEVDDDGAAAGLHDPPDFTLTAASGAQTISGPSGSLDVSHAEVEPDVPYELSEEGPPGYSSRGWECQAQDGDFTQQESSVTLDDGADVTCTVTNEFTGGWLTLAKRVEDSSQPSTNWELSAEGAGDAEGADLQGSSGSSEVTQVPVPAGEYDLAEEGPEGYLTDGFVCEDGAPGFSVTVEAGEDITCTITNRRDPDITQLTLAKTVENTGGGPLSATAWGLSAEGATEEQRDLHGRTGQNRVTYALVEPGTYTLSEEDLPAFGAEEEFAAYESGRWECATAGGEPLEVDDASEVDIPAGEQVRCEVLNTWTGASISFDKQIEEDPGVHSADDWELAVESADGGEAVVSGDGGGSAETGISGRFITPGEYRLSELSGPEGYEFSRFACSGAEVDAATGELTVPPSSEVECSVVNRALQPMLTLQKEIVNTGGGTAEAGDFVLMARGPGEAAVAGPSGDGAVTEVELPPGEYVFREDGPEGYEESWSCAGGESWDADSGVAVMGPGEHMVCTATNTWIAETEPTPSPTDPTPTDPTPTETDPGTAEPSPT